MIATGTFLYMPVKMADSAPTPVILGKTHRGYFICLPDYESAFELDHAEDLNTDCFIHYMDGYNAELVASTVKRAMELLLSCEGS